MKRALLKNAILVVEVCGVLIALAAALTGYMFWRLEQGPMRLTALEGTANTLIEGQFPSNHRSTLGSMSLVKDKQDGAYNIVVTEVTVADGEGRPVLTLPRAWVNITVDELIRGRARPRRIVVDGAKIDLIRRADRRLLLDTAGRGDGETRRPSIRKVLDRSAFLREVFERADLINAQLSFVDEFTGKSWQSSSAAATLKRTELGYIANGAASFHEDWLSSDVQFEAQLDEDEGRLSSELIVKNAPLQEILTVFLEQSNAIVTSRVSGTAQIEVDENGRLVSSSIKGSASNGELRFGDERIAVNDLRIDTLFDPEQNAFDVRDFFLETQKGAIAVTGDIILPSREEPDDPVVTFDIAAPSIVLRDTLAMPAPVVIEGASFKGAVNPQERLVSLSTLTATLNGLGVSGNIEYKLPSSSNGSAGISQDREIIADISVDGSLNPESILQLWPTNIGLGARDFVRDRMSAGTADNIRVKLDIRPDMIAEDGGLQNAAITVSFDIDDATVIYAPGMRPLTRARGNAVLRANHFHIKNITAAVGAIPVRNGDIEFVALRPRGQDVFYRFDARGDARDILHELNKPPLAILSSTALTPDMFSGPINARLEIMRPNLREAPREDFEISGRVRFSDLNLSGFYGDADLSKASGVLDLYTRYMDITGAAQLGGLPISMKWKHTFYDRQKGSRLVLKGHADSSTGDMFGIPTRRYVRGPVEFEAVALGGIGALRSLDLTTDFSDATLIVDPLGWSKPSGVPASGKLRIDFAPSKTFVRNIKLESAGLDVEGEFAFGDNGRIEGASFPVVRIDQLADFSLSAKRTLIDELNVSLIGAHWDASHGLDAFMKAAQAPSASNNKSSSNPGLWGAGVIFNGRLGELNVRDGVTYNDFYVDFWRDATRIQRFDVSARGDDGAVVSAQLKLTGEEQGVHQTVQVRTDNIGALMTGIFGVTSIKGGQGALDLFIRRQTTSLDDGGFESLTGDIEARAMQIIGAPLLARIFSAGSFGGLADLLNGGGIEINSATARFGFQDGAVIIRDLRAKGPSVGVSAEGRIASEENGGIDLNGAVAPAYQVNSILGRAPLIGDLFVNKEGEGVVALSYQINGTASQPGVVVNPLSALTPGVFRRLFEPDRATMEELMSPQTGDETVTPLDEALDDSDTPPTQ